MVLAVALALVAVASISGQTAAGQATPPGSVSVFPIPGDIVASPQTQIAFRGLPASQLEAASIQVTGSSSGVHTGTIEADSDGDGGSFIPSTPFQPGETVTVATSLPVIGSAAGTFQFTVATPAGGIPYRKRFTVPRVNGDVWRFRSRPDLAPAAVKLLKRTASAGNADIFLAPQFGPVQDGPEIVNSAGQLVWFDRIKAGDTAADFSVQSYQNKPVLSWWQGYTNADTGVGEDVIYNSAYQQIATVQAANGLSADLHEFEITPAGTALITSYYPVYWNATSVHGSKKQIVLDGVVQEIDIPTGLVLFQWDSLDHVPLTASFVGLPAENSRVGKRNPYDYFHLNSIALDDDGNLVISARNTWAAYKINIQTGAIIWTLGGKSSSFKFGSGASFAYQHDVGVVATGDRLVTVFDDGGGPPNVHTQSRGLELALNFRHMTATVVDQDDHSPPLQSDYEGNLQELPGSDQFIGWGQQPYFSEYDQHGHPILDGRFVGYTSSYRTYRFQWTGTPAVPPAVVTSISRGKTTVYVSWDGATTVASWRVMSGNSATALRVVKTASQSGFETTIQIPAAGYVRVQALDASGHVLSTSAIVRAH